MKHFIHALIIISLFSFTILAQAGPLKKVIKTANEVVEAVEPTVEDAVDAGADAVEWLKTTDNKAADYADELAKYNNILTEAWETGWSHSGSLEYTGPLSPAAHSGTFNVMTYNIDGFPKAMGGNSSEDTKSISAILESLALDIVVFQEDFTKHDELISNFTTATYPYRTAHWKGTATTFGDGLATVSKFPFNYWDYNKAQWDQCGGTLQELVLGTSSHPDCMTEKGFSMVTLDIDEGLQIDLYNLHQDAGGDSNSLAAKQNNMAQLAEYINTHSAGKVIIVAGDFNMKLGSLTSAKERTHLSIWIDFLNNTGLSVMCMEVYKNWNDCDADGFDKPDHILFKGNNEYDLYALTIDHAAEFGEINKIDNENGLSDHYPIKGAFYWEKN
ncbi:MAG: endonuclease/exonuclease/phosphatase family protein [Gammaproteobacteria bacterium]|nr:endonuclease/exonuclease/phosphatase family protein [Gammaproteobacteria bacterium]